MYSRVSNIRTCIFFQIKVSHSNRMLSIQIDTKIFNRSYVQQHQIALLCKQYETELFTSDAVRLLDIFQ